MLKKANRLNNTLFAKYFAQGKRIHSENLTTVFSPNEGFLCAVVVGKKIYKKAHERNLLRRRIYTMVREVAKNKTVKGVYIFLVKPTVKNLTKKQFKDFISEEVGRILK